MCVFDNPGNLPTVYIAGPMRGIPEFNFPAFDEAKKYLEGLGGYHIISPADIDRERKLVIPEGTDVTLDIWQECMKIDLKIVADASAILLLKGWENSKGANAELFVANTCGVPVWVAEYWANGDGIFGYSVHASGEILPPMIFPPRKKKVEKPEESICQEADRIVAVDRQDVYGHPFDDFSRTAAMWSGYKGVEFTPEDIAMMMVLLKVSRLANTPGHRDSVVDIAGYAKTMNLVQQRRAESV